MCMYFRYFQLLLIVICFFRGGENLASDSEESVNQEVARNGSQFNREIRFGSLRFLVILKLSVDLLACFNELK